MMNFWRPVSRPALSFLAVVSLVMVWLCWTHNGFVPVLDDANLVFHEAGHPIFGLLGSTAGLYGGTLGQLVIPLLVVGHFRRQREPVGFMVGAFWFFENGLNIARYMADARAQLLPLVGGGEHDWAMIFARWGVLDMDVQIAGVVKTCAWLGIFMTLAWFFCHGYRYCAAKMERL